MSENYSLPPHVFSDDPSEYNSRARVKVDVAQTGFEQGRQYRISYEFDIPNGSSRVIKFDSPIDFILQGQNLAVDDGAVLFRAFRSADVTDNGGFVTIIPVIGINIMSIADPYVGQVTLSTDGTITPDTPPPGVLSLAVETIRLRSPTASGQRTTIGETIGDERGLPAGSYYLEFTNIAASGAATGVYSLRWEEEPADLNDWLIDTFGRYE